MIVLCGRGSDGCSHVVAIGIGHSEVFNGIIGAVGPSAVANLQLQGTHVEGLRGIVGDIDL